MCGGRVSADEYLEKKCDVASNMIHDFEKHVGVELAPYIEEIEIATPVTMARYTLKPAGDDVLRMSAATGIPCL